LTGGALGVDVDRIPREALLAVSLRDVVGEGGTESTVGVDDVAFNANGQTLEKRRLRKKGRRQVSSGSAEGNAQLGLLFSAAPAVGDSNRAESRVKTTKLTSDSSML
jgi:hypothetical protein